MAKKTKVQLEIDIIELQNHLTIAKQMLKESSSNNEENIDSNVRMKVLRHYIKRQLSRGLEIQGIDVQEIAEWPLNMVLKWFPVE
jgi:hypothetical protein